MLSVSRRQEEQDGLIAGDDEKKRCGEQQCLRLAERGMKFNTPRGRARSVLTSTARLAAIASRLREAISPVWPISQVAQRDETENHRAGCLRE